MVTGEQQNFDKMKKSLFVTMLLMLSMVAYAQKDVTKFLGIPIDGSKPEMIRKLKEKGFQSVPGADFLTGEFNGTKVYVSVVTNNNKVWRIMLSDVNRVSERTVQIRFNRLCEQFTNNPKYMSLSQEQTIPEDEDISYEMTAHKKRYEAAFYQNGAAVDSAYVAEKVKSFLLSKYTEEQLQNPTEEERKEMMKLSVKYLLDDYSKRSVWFMISSDSYGEYYITMFYDNEYNHANGEDL